MFLYHPANELRYKLIHCIETEKFHQSSYALVPILLFTKGFLNLSASDVGARSFFLVRGSPIYYRYLAQAHVSRHCQIYLERQNQHW